MVNKWGWREVSATQILFYLNKTSQLDEQFFFDQKFFRELNSPWLLTNELTKF